MLELLEDLRRPLVLREWLSDPIGILGPMHRDVLEVSQRSAASPLDLLQELVPAAMFDFGHLSWSQILDLRSSTHVHDFRRHIRELELLPAATIRQRWHDDIETMAALGKPSLGKVLVSGILGNLPISPLNPIAIGQSVTDYFRSDETLRRFGWVYFVMEGRDNLNSA